MIPNNNAQNPQGNPNPVPNNMPNGAPQNGGPAPYGQVPPRDFRNGQVPPHRGSDFNHEQPGVPVPPPQPPKPEGNLTYAEQTKKKYREKAPQVPKYDQPSVTGAPMNRTVKKQYGAGLIIGIIGIVLAVIIAIVAIVIITKIVKKATAEAPATQQTAVAQEQEDKLVADGHVLVIEEA